MKLIIVKPVEFDIELPYYYKETKPVGGDEKEVDIYYRLEEKRKTALYVYKNYDSSINHFSTSISVYNEGLQSAIDNRKLFWNDHPDSYRISSKEEFDQVKENLKKVLNKF